ncbi:MAG: redoxin domain-containing protein, partial [Deltaproteobacteria bacterium]|nr:redoxin domain-containing protein [Deltaproteobacteria bacterium]
TEEGEPVGVRINELLFEEITLDDDYRSTKVAGAKAYCMRDIGLSGLVGEIDTPNSKEVEAAQPQDSCLAEGTGTGVGHNVGDFSLKNCLGETVALHDGCGDHQAIWMVTTAGWCTACESWIPQVQSQYEALSERGLELYVLLGSDLNFAAPTQEYCVSYAEQKGLDPAKVLIDDGWQVLFENVDHYDYNFTPINFMLDGQNMAYVWSDAANDGTTTSLNQALQKLLD